MADRRVGGKAGSPKMKFGKYEIIEPLGSGTYAEIFRAVDLTTNRTVALKVLRPALMGDEETISRFMQEASTAANLDHPRIAWVWDIGEFEGRYYLATRFIPGQSLSQMLKKKGAQSWKEAFKIILQIGEALSFIHKKKLVHRDVKPQNILLDPDTGAVLVDFGLVRSLDSTIGTRTGVIMGTPAYIAPEIWSGKIAGPASDQYALACVLVEMLTGKVLFNGADTPATMKMHFEQPRIPIAWSAHCPKRLSKILLKALAQNPVERFTDINKFISALHEADAEQQAEERPDNKSGEPLQPSKTGQVTLVPAVSAPESSPISQTAPVEPIATPTIPIPQTQSNDGPLIVFILLFLLSIGLSIGFGVSYFKTDTSLKSARTTVIAQSTEISYLSTLSSAYSRTNAQIHPPTDGSLRHIEDDYVKTEWINSNIHNSVIEATFTNPYDANLHNWDYGFLFRHTGSNMQYRIYVGSDKQWILTLAQGDNKPTINSGSLEDFSIEASGKNSIRLIINDLNALFYVNDTFISVLDLSGKNESGDVGIGTGFTIDSEWNGYETQYTGFTVWQLP